MECKICYRDVAIDTFTGVCNDCKKELLFVKSLFSQLAACDNIIDIAFFETADVKIAYQINNATGSKRLEKSDLLGLNIAEFQRKLSQLLYVDFNSCSMDGVAVTKYSINLRKYKKL